MSLQECPECQKEISSSANECPHCGYPLSEKTVMVEKHTVPPARQYGWNSMIYLIIFVAGLFMLLEGEFSGLLLLIIGVVLVIALIKRWSQSGKNIK